jgi:ParB-like chromosome segregation protein Spo0J
MNDFKNVKSSNLKVHHPAAQEFPQLEPKQFEELKVDIEKRGLLHPVVMRRNVILDGRHRLLACEELGITPRFVEYKGNDEVGFIIANNILRRHLTDDQRVALLAKLRGPMLSKEAEARMKSGHPALKSAEGCGEAATRLAKDAHVGRDKARDALAVVRLKSDLINDVIAGKQKLAEARREAKVKAEADKQARKIKKRIRRSRLNR